MPEVSYGGGRYTIDGYYVVSSGGVWRIYREDVEVAWMLALRDVSSWIASNPVRSVSTR
jgi:hypothetical protein